MEVRKTVTVVFADVIGSTALGESLDPESVRGIMARYFEEMRSAVERHGGTVEKFIGDAVMAVFGVPVLHEDDALRAVRAAWQMRQSLLSLNEELGRDWAANIAIRTGINTGEVLAGDPASGDSFVSGDAVNVAARLEQAAEAGEILIGEETYKRIRDAIEVEPTQPLDLKGKAEPIPAFRLLSVKPGAPSFARSLDSPLVGREKELDRLLSLLDEAASLRSCRVATIVADAGVGKSRLVSEVAHRAGSRARILTGQCLPYGEGITFWPVAELVRNAAGIGEADSPEEAASKIRDLVRDVDDGAGIAEQVAGAIGLGQGTGDIQQTFWAVRRLLEELARDNTLLVVFEDIHWAEGTFLDMLRYIAAFSSDHPILLLCTTRPDIRDLHPEWLKEGESVVLETLDEDQCAQLIENLLGRAGLPTDVRTRVMNAAEGNPLFVEEMLRMLIDDGILERTNGHWTAAGDLSKVSVPGNISALLSARLDQLEMEERAVIQRASVVGRVFWWGAVTDLSPEGDRPGVGPHLQTLLRKELVRPDHSTFVGEDAFRFSHILVRDAAYGSMPKRARAELHERFATWLELKARDRVSEFDEILGYHLEQAYRYRSELGPPDERTNAVAGLAVEHLVVAGRRAHVQGDLSATRSLLSRAAGLLAPDDPVRLEILPDLGLALAQSDIVKADEVLKEAIEGARSTADRHLEARAAIRRVVVRLLLDPKIDQEASLQEAESWIEVFEEFGDGAGLGEAKKVVATIHFWQGRAGVAEAELEDAIQYATAGGDKRQESEILRWLAIVVGIGPTPAETGLHHLKSIVDRSANVGRVEVAVTRSRATLEGMCGRLDRARELAARGKALALEVGDLVGHAAALRDSGFVETLAGDLVAAEAEFRAAWEIQESVSDWGHLSSTGPELGDAVYSQGRYDEALRISEFCESISIEGDADAEIKWRQLRAKVLARQGKMEEAEALARDAVRVAEETDYLLLHALALRSLAEVLRLDDRKAEAAEALQSALELEKRKGNVVGRDNTASLLDELAR